jgi:hypothetical protein
MRKRAIFYAHIENGALKMQCLSLMKAFIQTFQEGDKIQVTVEKQSDSLGENQMKYYFGVVIPAGMKHTGYETPQQMDAVFKAMFLTECPDTDFERIKSKTELDTYERSEFIEKCIMFLSSEGVNVEPADKEWKIKRNKTIQEKL